MRRTFDYYKLKSLHKITFFYFDFLVFNTEFRLPTYFRLIVFGIYFRVMLWLLHNMGW